MRSFQLRDLSRGFERAGGVNLPRRSANGATHTSLGHRPRNVRQQIHEGLKARSMDGAPRLRSDVDT
jgi:hypothetical protein